MLWPITSDSPDTVAAAEMLDATTEGLLHIYWCCVGNEVADPQGCCWGFGVQDP